MNELINLDGLGDAIINLTNKLANGVGWIVNKETPKKLAINAYIQDIQQSDYDPLTKAALISNAKKIINGYCNQKDIVEIAIQSLKKKAKPEKVEDDWLGQFMDKARLISSQEFQWIWGKILAKECNEPGSIPLALLHILEKMDKEDAETFTCLCRISVKLEGDFSPVVIESRIEEYNKLGITFDGLINLKALGLIEMDLGSLSSGYTVVPDGIPAKLIYFDKELQFSQDEIRVGHVIFTKYGQALCQSIDVKKIDGFWEKYCLSFWKELNDKKESSGNTLATKNQ